MSPRAAHSPANPDMSPDTAEKHENRIPAPIRIGLRRPSLSENLPTKSPDRAQVNASTPDRVPSWVLVSSKSFLISGARKDRACRSKKTKPKARNRISRSRPSYRLAAEPLASSRDMRHL